MTSADPPVDPRAGRVLVAGSINMDTVVTSSRHLRVGETVIGDEIARFPGGKGSNQVVAAAAAGVAAEFIGAVGDDDAGAKLRAFLEEHGVLVRHLQSIQGVDSGLAIVIVAEDDNAVVVVSGANACFGPDALEDVSIGPDDVLVSQFEIAEETVQAFFERGKAAGARTVLNPSPIRAFSAALWELSDVIVVNEIEMLSLAEMRGVVGSRSHLLRNLDSLLSHEGQAMVITLGADGCVVATHGEVVSIPGRKVRVVDTTGAGDCFLGFMAGRFVHGDDLVSAADLANVAASLCVQRMGAGSSMPSADEVAAIGSARFDSCRRG